MNKTGLLLIALVTCLPATGTLAEQPERAQLGHDQLMSADHAVNGPVANNFFMPQDGAAAAHHRFSAAITIPEHAMRTAPEVILPTTVAGKETQLFPGVTLHFVSHGEYLVPVERDIIAPPGSDSFWQIQVSPGRVWSEENDEAMSRASFPFFLTSIIENETYNGIATFLYDDESVSELRYQIVQQLSRFSWKPGSLHQISKRSTIVQRPLRLKN